MPNHIINTIRLTGDRQKISELLESVKDNRFGIVNHARLNID